jgi:hypothetical protein
MTECSPVGIYRLFGETTKSGIAFFSKIGVEFSLRNSEQTHTDRSVTAQKTAS